MRLRQKEVRMKLLYVLFALIVVRIGCNIPIPGVNGSVMQEMFNNNKSLGFLDVMTGGSFSRMSIFALNITPYITASIILQLLTIAIPRLEELQKDGEDGRKKINEYTRYLSIVLAVIEGLAMVIGFRNQNIFKESGYVSMIVAVVSLTAGAAFLMWLGEQITVKGVGNGISIILLINIVARIPSDLAGLYNTYIKGASNITNALIAGVIIVAVIVAMYVFIVFLQDGERRIPVQYAKKIQGKKSGWRTVKPYSTEGKYRRCYPSYLCKFHDVSSSCNCQLCRYFTGNRSKGYFLSEVFDRLQPEFLV